MREIKFRAWDNVVKEMLPNVQNHINDPDWAFGRMLQNGDRFSIMQFTGLLDKNGREIYEGDICKLVTDSFSEKLGKSYKEWTVEIWYQQFDASFVATSERTESALTWHFGETDFNGHQFIYEVIGNIYEHPNLLKP